MKSPLAWTVILATAIATCVGCVGRQAYYVSPFNGNVTPYHTVPAFKDSARSALYANGALAWGTANDRRADRSFAGSLNIAHGIRFGSFQAFYSAGFTAGTFHVDTFAMTGNHETVNPAIINALAGRNSFSGAGFNGGINYVLPIQNGEWRVFGLETSMRKEWGRYLQFRKDLPDSAATIIVRSDSYSTLGGFTEFLAHSGANTYGFKAGVGTVLGRGYRTRSIQDSDIGFQNLIFNYFDLTFHLTHGKWTGYLQYKDATKARTFILGANFRFTK